MAAVSPPMPAPTIKTFSGLVSSEAWAAIPFVVIIVRVKSIEVEEAMFNNAKWMLESSSLAVINVYLTLLHTS